MIEMLSTWGTAGNGYLNQEGHQFIAVGRTDREDFPYLFESVATPGHTVAGRRTGYGRIETEAPAPAEYRVSYHGAGRWQVTTTKGEVVGLLHQTFMQAWYATSATGTRLAVNGAREWGGQQGPYEIANTMVEWFSQDSDSQPTHGDPWGV